MKFKTKLHDKLKHLNEKFAAKHDEAPGHHGRHDDDAPGHHGRNRDDAPGHHGRNHDDTLVGTDADDVLRGKRGDDSLVGARGDDKIVGGGGDDYLSGNQGNDILKGGRGADIFVFDGDFDRDIVRDFNACEGDSFEFVLYDPAQADWTGATLLDLCVARGRDVVLDLPGMDDSVTLKNTDLSDLTADMFEVVLYSDSFELVA